jgi:hypothetical protein
MSDNLETLRAELQAAEESVFQRQREVTAAESALRRARQHALDCDKRLITADISAIRKTAALAERKVHEPE